MNATMTFNETAIRSASAATKPQVIAVHGSASTGGQWRRLASELGASFDVAMPDLPGYGALQNVLPGGRPTLAGDGIEIERIAVRAGKRCHLVAHSYGAAVALNYARNFPRMVASLTLIEPVLFHLLRSGEARDIAHYTEISAIADEVRMAAQFGTPARGMARFVDYWNGDGTWAAMKPSLQAALAAQTMQVARNFEAAFAETWPPADCCHIACPTLIITAAESRAPARRVAEVIARAIPGAREATIACAGHMVPVTHPDIINPLIAEALAGATPGPIEASPREAA